MTIWKRIVQTYIWSETCGSFNDDYSFKYCLLAPTGALVATITQQKLCCYGQKTGFLREPKKRLWKYLSVTFIDINININIWYYLHLILPLSDI